MIGPGVVTIKATYALLDSVSRRLVGNWCDETNKNGVKLKHCDGTIYQVLNIHDFGYSPNVLDLHR